MVDREKVIKGLTMCRAGRCDYRCPYVGINVGCKIRLKDDAIELLKEQEAEWIEYPECLAYEGAYSNNHIVCSACKHVFSTMDNCTEEFDYCPHCGAKMKQESR